MRRRSLGLRGEGGQAAAMLVLMLPAMMLVLGGVADVGLALWERQELRQACDLAALAAAQDIDLDRLARGERFILPAEARADALAYVRLNLARLPPDSYAVSVAVLNPGAQPLREPWTGRWVRDPTVAVHVEADMPSVFLSALHPTFHVAATADASVLAHP